MRLEHIAIVVGDPNAVAEWYCKNLGMRVVRQGGGPNFMTFLQDSSGQTMVEIYARPELDLPDYASMDVFALHFAFYTDDPQGARDSLVEAGATVVQEPAETEAGDTLVMLRDPWGVTLQLVKRKEPLG